MLEGKQWDPSRIIKEILEEKGLTDDELGKGLQVSSTLIRNIRTECKGYDFPEEWSVEKIEKLQKNIMDSSIKLSDEILNQVMTLTTKIQEIVTPKYIVKELLKEYGSYAKIAQIFGKSGVYWSAVTRETAGYKEEEWTKRKFEVFCTNILSRDPPEDIVVLIKEMITANSSILGKDALRSILGELPKKNMEIQPPEIKGEGKVFEIPLKNPIQFQFKASFFRTLPLHLKLKEVFDARDATRIAEICLNEIISSQPMEILRALGINVKVDGKKASITCDNLKGRENRVTVSFWNPTNKINQDTGLKVETFYKEEGDAEKDQLE